MPKRIIENVGEGGRLGLKLSFSLLVMLFAFRDEPIKYLIMLELLLSIIRDCVVESGERNSEEC